MAPRRFLSIQQQVAERLKSDIQSEQWTDLMPGRNQLVKLMEVSGKTIDLALKQLEKEGVLIPQGPGKRRKIVSLKSGAKVPSLRVRILLYEQSDQYVDSYLNVLHRLEESGHDASFATKSLQNFRMNPKRVATFVNKTTADAWIVCSGSREVLSWFVEQQISVFAMFGLKSELPIAGVVPHKVPVLQEVVKKLVDLGHQRIVMISREERRKLPLALYERTFLDELESHGIESSSFNLPEWKDDKKGFHQCLKSLFAVTPPTAMILSEPELFIAAQLHLARNGINAPDDISLVCDDPVSRLSWCEPNISHIYWDSLPVVKRIQQWTDNIARGKEDTRQTLTKASFVEGGTIGPVPN